MPDIAKKMMGDPEQYLMMITKSFENRIPILVITLVAAALCIYGAMQMRQLKKQGFLIYVVGEILPIISTALFIGVFMFTGINMIIAMAIALLFIIMYAVNRKHLIY
jgi:tryptophan-rich sensory protein